MTFTAIDFETAHADFPCEIGICRIENGVVTDTFSKLIKPACFPYMNPWNERIHGISAPDVAGSPLFDELWNAIKPYLEDTLIVAHNAAFDMKVLKSALKYYDLAVPYSDYFCSVHLSRKTWKHLTSHSLENLCHYHSIRFTHHRAGEDARACALITLKAFDEMKIYEIDDLKKLGVKVHSLTKN